jgi:putative SOS response-associated peptidase YedK
MCYSVSQLKLKKYKNAIRAGLDDDTRIRLYQDYLDSYFKEFDINQKDYKYYHVSGFNYDKPLTVIVDEPDFLQEMSWGLIPNWVGSEEKASEIRTKTINARGETMFEKPSFKDAALNKRCLLIVDGFFEYHRKPGRKIPYRIKRKDDRPLIIAGIWDESKALNTRTFSIVTTEANELMTEIHNNGKEARMPLLLDEKTASTWLKPIASDMDKQDITKLIKPSKDIALDAFPVRQILGGNGVGDDPKAIDPFDEIPTLF